MQPSMNGRNGGKVIDLGNTTLKLSRTQGGMSSQVGIIYDECGSRRGSKYSRVTDLLVGEAIKFKRGRGQGVMAPLPI